MSSAAQLQSSQRRYFCYACNREVPIYMVPDPTCQRCNEQFVQEIEPENDPQSFLNGDGDTTAAATDAGQHQSSAYFRYDSQNGGDLFQFLDGLVHTEGTEEPNGSNNDNQSSPTTISTILQNMVTLLMSQPPEPSQGEHLADEEGERTSQSRTRQPSPLVFYGDMVDGHLRVHPANVSPQQQQRQQDEASQRAPGNGEDATDTVQSPTEEGAAAGGDARGGDNQVNNFASSLLRLLYGLSEGVVGNPNDYVFSQDGFDSIITQLMEQANGGNAPPPAPEAVINTLPKRKITDKEIEDITDCPVCKDEFGPTEEVDELPCQHIFHEDCIKPWLKVNGTCPVCRHSVLPEKKDADSGVSENNNSGSAAGNDNDNNTSQAMSSANDAPNSHPLAYAVGGLSPAFSSLLGNPRGPIPSLAGWFSRSSTDAIRNYSNSSNQQHPFSAFLSSSSTPNTLGSRNNNNTPQQSSSDSNNHNTDYHSEMDLDLD